jgi:hypothetical protein
MIIRPGKVVIIDDEDYEHLKQFDWQAQKDCNTYYASRNVKISNNNWKIIYMHWDILGRKEGLITDHINGNGLDNRRENLRHVTHRQNCQNKHIKKSSKYPGVCWCSTKLKWKASIQNKGKRYNLGYFISEKDAFSAYCAAVRDLKEEILYEAVGDEDE